MVDNMPKVNLCTSSFVFNTIQSHCPKRCIILDTRSTESYRKKGLSCSLNLDKEEIEKKLRTLSEEKDRQNTQKEETIDTKLTFAALQALTPNPCWKEKLQNIKRSFCIIIFNNQKSLSEYFRQESKTPGEFVCSSFKKEFFHLQDAINSRYNDTDEDIASIRFGLDIYNMLFAQKVQELYILVDGVDGLFDTYTFMERKFYENVKVPPLSIKYPNDILDARLFLGDQQQGTNQTVIKQLNLTHVLNCTLEINNAFEGDLGLRYLKLAVTDDDDTFLAKHFKEAYEFIEEALSDENGRVLVHCAMGKSRSASIVIMYLMKKFKWSYDDAFRFVEEKRPVIKPNYGFETQLQNFEKRNYKFEENSPECKIEELGSFTLESSLEDRVPIS